MMFGPRITTVFRSRWNALFWAAGMLLTAYCSVPGSEDQGGDQTQIAAKTQSKHTNPWAKDSPSSPN